jgi:hypothetical protein
MSEQTQTTPGTIAIPVSIVALLVAYAKLPYGYYMGLRCLICGVSIYLAFAAYGWIRNESLRLGVCVGLGICAAVYNPIIKVRLDRDAWEIINGLTIAGLVGVLLVLRSYRIKKGSSNVTSIGIMVPISKTITDTNEGKNTVGKIMGKSLAFFAIWGVAGLLIILVIIIVGASRIPSREEMRKPVDPTTLKRPKNPSAQPASVAAPQINEP